jgi:chemotaxis protein CheY-P-specific phosphatase CheC
MSIPSSDVGDNNGNSMHGNASADDNKFNLVANMIKFAILNKCIDAIDKMLNDNAIINSMSIREITMDDIYATFDYNNNVFAVYIKGVGDLQLTLLLIIHSEDSKRLAEIIIGNALGYELSNELVFSAVAEFGNILLAGAFTNALTNCTGFRIECTAPGYANDTLASILEYIIADSGALQFIYSECKLSFKVNKDLNITISVLIPSDDARKLVEPAFRS